MGLVALDDTVLTLGSDILTYVLAGVIASIIILIILVVTFGIIIINGNKPKQAKSEPLAFVTPPAQSVQDDNEIIAVIAAAVASMYDGTGKSAIIRSVRPSIRPNRSVWSAAGIYENTRAF